MKKDLFTQFIYYKIVIFITDTHDNNTTPNSLQWAVRNTPNISQSSNTTTAAAHIAGSGLVFIDPAQLRRSASAASVDGGTPTAMFCTPSALARTFGCLIREVNNKLRHINVLD